MDPAFDKNAYLCKVDAKVIKFYLFANVSG